MFYELTKQKRQELVTRMTEQINRAVKSKSFPVLEQFFSDEDTYIRKNAYLLTGRLYFQDPSLQKKILAILGKLADHDDYKVRQSVLNAAGEVGKKGFEVVAGFFDKGLFDTHHVPRNAVIGSIKKMAEVNPRPVLSWAAQYLTYPDKEIRREICHGIELRGRKYPGDILPMLQQLEFDKTRRVRDTLVHVLGQIAYKKGCLPVVVDNLKGWKNKELVSDALMEIIDVHKRYKSFAALTVNEAKKIVALHKKH